MANYIIIGGDGKEYGPVTTDDLRQWIAEGRLNAQSQAKAESDAEFRPLEKYPDFAGLFAPATIAPLKTSAEFHERDFELDLLGCISGGWEQVKEHFGILVLSFLILVGVEIAFIGLLNLIAMPFTSRLLSAPVVVRLGVNFLNSAVASLVMGPMLGGLYFVYLKVIRQQPVTVGEVFAGFQKAFGQLFLGTLVVSLILGMCMLPFNYVWQVKAGPLLEQMQHLKNSSPTEVQNIFPQLLSAATSSLPLLFLCLIPMTYLTVCWQFTLPLIMDKQMDFGTAMKTSWTMVNKHWWQVFGLTILIGLVSLVGVIACCVGALVTIPIGMAALMIAYETIFGVEKK